MHDWGSKGNVLRNPILTRYAPLGPRSRLVYQHSTQGTVIFEFSGTSGSTTLLTAGVHGDEVWSVIGLLNLVDALPLDRLSGTVYVIPIVNPAGLANHSRAWRGVDPNRVADVPGSLTWHLVRFARERGVECWLDLHCGHGVPHPGTVLTDHRDELAECLVRTVGVKPVVEAAPRGSIRRVGGRFGIRILTLEVPKDSGLCGVSTAYRVAREFLRLTNDLNDCPPFSVGATFGRLG